ncbi:ABC transporter substrate-binding protein [Aliirhizobium cellulosilyticum]|uniref:Thiamine pyrimidine synthase n=1 Tax=Aliirhizobium cellulosilyticum TaxID=393664 RepID=A0A7W6S9Y2_9HYPH|nr:ABC transporter substrate-binding protein [Rhizobium cellulosilyticum]MBB4349927.1 ABC-type nitrate/sulfonate/bicarbonate transport system substrate-binding protein [Rhizobium cellulosilyticum]MBB4413106.1 ABC-type nitrate/sulfonate/bicarbonate transport system substrate-binding protein [Rhizobium cellulosilyticum]MBB4447957.1 ABC-type nitrate/sulfonate/bicarbonate transport system substrate-binding protein [Rhizobium cellulosilyticum]
MHLSLNRRHFMGLMGAAATMPMMGHMASAATPFNFQASWINDAEFAGYFLAADKGYYKEAGLELEYLSGGPDVIPESSIIAGKADLTLTTPDTTIKAIVEQGAPFKIIGAQYQKNPIGIVSLAKNPIKEPKDLIGKTLAVPPVNVISVEAMLKISGIDRAQVNIVPYAYDPTPLIKGEIDASVDFTTNVPFTIKQAGEEATSFLLYDFGFTIFNDTVVVTEEVLKTKRKEIVAFVKASRKGWEENLKDPAAFPKTFADTWFKGTGRSIENEVYFNTAQKPLIENANGIFSMSDEAIAANIEALAAVGITAKREYFDTTVLEEV